MWASLAAELAHDHTIVAPDLRGMGLSARPASGYDKKRQGQDVAGVLDALGIERVGLVMPTTSAIWSDTRSPPSTRTG